MWTTTRGIAILSPPAVLSPPPPPVTSPVTILGAAIHAWWTAGAGVTESSGLVGTWTDQVSGLAPTQGSSSLKPIYNATSFRGDQPGLTFDGIDDYLTSNAVGSLPQGTNPFEVWALFDQVASPADADVVRDLMTIGGTANNSFLGIRRTIATSTNRGRATTGGMNISDTSVDLTGRHWARAYYDGTSIGISVDGSTPTTAAAASQATSNTRVRIGNTASGTTTGWEGVIAQIVVTNALLNSTQISDLNIYFGGLV